MLLQKRGCALCEANTKCILHNTLDLKALPKLMEDGEQRIGKRRYHSFPISVVCLYNNCGGQAK